MVRQNIYPQAIRIQGVLRCPTCNTVLRPKHWKKNCCKAAYKKYWAEIKIKK